MENISNQRFLPPTWALFMIILLLSPYWIHNVQTTPIENITSVNLQGLSESDNSDTIFIRSLDVLDTFQVIQVSQVAGKLLEVNFEVTVRKEKCCPVLFFLAHLPNETYKGPGYIKEKCFSDGFQSVASFSEFFIYIKQGFPNSVCVDQGYTLLCSGKRKLGFTSPRIWWIMVGYPCYSIQPLQMDIRMSLNFNTQTTCEVLEEATCVEKYYQTKTGFPNLLGQSSQSAASLFYQNINTISLQTKCYKHLELFLCKSIFQDCSQSGSIPPCKQMCKDLMTGCKDDMANWKQGINCQYFPASLDPNVCYYLPVTCPVPFGPRHGSLSANGRNLSSIALYECEEGYEPVGPTIRACLYSGEWNGTDPVCVQHQSGSTGSLTVHHKLFIGLACGVVLIVIVGLFILFRHSINLLLFYNDYVSNYRANPEVHQKGMFLTYSSLDSDYVEETLMLEIKEHVPTWKITTFEKDLIPGQSQLDTVNKCIWQCQAIVVFLTENYIRSAWCEYELSEAQTRTAIDRDFRLIIIYQQQEGQRKPFELNQLPEHLRPFIKTRIYVKAGEVLFRHKLRKGLKK